MPGDLLRLSAPILLLATSLLGTGCVPATWTVVPELRGRVLTTAGDPVADAKVRIVPAKPSSEEVAVEIATDAQGRFHRREQTRWTMVPLLPLDGFSREFAATAYRANAESEPKRFGGNGIVNPHHFGLTNQSPSFDLGDLVLDERPVGQ